MPIDPERLLALEFPVVERRHSRRDSTIYALGVGFGIDLLDERQLRFVAGDDLAVAPTMATVLANHGFWARDLDTGIDWVKAVHGQQSLRLHAPLPEEGEIRSRARVVDIVDKGTGRGALVYTERVIEDVQSGRALATLAQTLFCRGDGGFGGKAVASREQAPAPTQAPDLTIDLPTHRQLALIYRLCGDLNPLHCDPAIARRAGYDQPILHGLATFGIAGHALLKALCAYEPSRFQSIDARFSGPVFPGETIITEIWREGPGAAAFRCRVRERATTVISDGHFTYAGEQTPRKPPPN